MREVEARLDDLDKILSALLEARYMPEEIASLFLTGLVALAESTNMLPGSFYSVMKETALSYKHTFEKKNGENRKTEMR